MARIRSAKPDFWTDPLMCSLSRDIRFTFKGIWEVCADDSGRFLADARVIKGKIWPLDDDITTRRIDKYIEAIANCGRIVLYVVHGVRYGYVVNWLKHQKISHPSPSTHPEPPAETLRSHSGNTPEPFASDSVLSGAERIGEERNRSGAEELAAAAMREDLDPVIRPEDRAAPPAPLVVLPLDAVRFVEQLYSLGTEKRQLDVRRQLYETLSPLSRGARLRKGVHVKARSPEHLAQCCRAVLEDPPRNIDAAIVILLEKLQDAPPGPSLAERTVERDKALVEREESYRRAARAAGVKWARDNPAEYEPLRLAVERDIPGKGTEAFVRLARESALTQRCAKAAAFPDFETWSNEQPAEPARREA